MDTSSSSSVVQHLSTEIIELILTRCPIKSVVRFKSVSKSWQSIISGRSFSRIHRIQRSRMLEDENTTFFLWEKVRWDKRKYGLHLIRLEEDEKFRTKSESLLLGCPSSGKEFELLCSCNGLIFLRADNNEYMLWNPLIQKHIIIPTPNHPIAYRNWIKKKTPRTFHLYHDSITDDYKIVFHYEPQCYTVYSCRNGSWGEIKHFPAGLDWKECLYGIDGSCLYGMSRDNTQIISFDVRDEKLHKFPLPKSVEECIVDQLTLEAVSGRLCLYGYNDYRDYMLHLWVMEENGSSWRKLVSMEKEERDIWNIRPVYISNKDDIVLEAKVLPGRCTIKYEQHFIYNPHGNCSFKQIDDYGEVGEVFPYSENLDMPYPSSPPIPHSPRKRRKGLASEGKEQRKGMFTRDLT